MIIWTVHAKLKYSVSHSLKSNRTFVLLLPMCTSQLGDKKVMNMLGCLGQAIGLWIFPLAKVLGKTTTKCFGCL